MTMKPVLILPLKDPPYREARIVDEIIGKRRKSAVKDSPIDFSKCPLAQRYPTIEDFLEAIAHDRRSALAEGRLPHPATRPPSVTNMGKNPPRDPPPWEDGPTVGDVKRAYPSTKQ